MTTIVHQPEAAHQLSSKPRESLQITQPDTNHQGLTIPRGPVTASLSFYIAPEDGSNPYNYVEKQVDGVPQRNFSESWEAVTIEDLRGLEREFNLDDNAFNTVRDIHSREHEFQDDERIRTVYYPEVEQLLLTQLPGAERVLLFDHTIRRSHPDAHRTPVTRVHIDQTPASAAARVRRHLPEEAEQLLKGRYRIVNVWRPINGPVMTHPLAVADSATVRNDDLIGVEHRYPDRTGETAAVQHNPEQKWYYWSGMRNEDRLLLKCFDSDEQVGSWGRVPHTAFIDPRSPLGAAGRESIEVRALVFG